MELSTALMMFVMLAYIVGMGVIAVCTYFNTAWITIVALLGGYLFVKAVRRVALNSIENYLHDGIGCEANRLCYTHSEEALNLLSKGKYEDLKVHLIDKSNGSVRKLEKLDEEYSA